MSEMLLGMILGAILFCALQLLLANDRLDDIEKALYDQHSKDEEESTDA